MGLSTGTKIALGAAGLVAVGAIVKSQISKFKDAASNFTFNVFFKRIHSLKLNVLTVVYCAQIKNLSGISVTAKNVFVLLQFSSDNGMNWDNIGASNKRINVPLKDNETASVEMEVQVNMSDTLTSLLAKSNRYRIVVKYEVLGVQKQYVKAYDFTKNLKSIPGFKGIDGVQKAPTLGQKKDLLKSIVINIRHVYAFPFSQTGKLKSGVLRPTPSLPKRPGGIPSKLNKILRINKPIQANPISPVIKALKPATPNRPIPIVRKPVLPLAPLKPMLPKPVLKPISVMKPLIPARPMVPIKTMLPVRPLVPFKAPIKTALPFKPVTLIKAPFKPIAKPAIKQFKGDENLI